MQISNLKPQNDNSNFKIEFNKRLIRFSLDTINFCAEIRQIRNLIALADQLIRSACSVGANIIEAKSCGSKKDYIRFFEIALKSANETKYWLILVKESEQKLSERASRMLSEADEISRIIGSGVITMKGKR